MNKTTVITKTIVAIFFAVLSMQVAKANETLEQEEILVPTLNPETGQIEYRHCPTFPNCEPTVFTPQELEDEEEQ